MRARSAASTSGGGTCPVSEGLSCPNNMQAQNIMVLKRSVIGVPKTIRRSISGFGRNQAAFFILSVQAGPGALEYRPKHRRSQLAGGGVLLAGMVRADEDGPAGSRSVFDVVPEPEGRPGTNGALFLQNREVDVHRDLPEHHDYPQLAQQPEFVLQIWPAVADFFGQRFVTGRRASDRRRDPR